MGEKFLPYADPSLEEFTPSAIRAQLFFRHAIEVHSLDLWLLLGRHKLWVVLHIPALTAQHEQAELVLGRGLGEAVRKLCL